MKLNKTYDNLELSIPYIVLNEFHISNDDRFDFARKYYFQYSGNKEISPFVKSVFLKINSTLDFNDDNLTIDSNDLTLFNQQAGRIISSQYYFKWFYLHDAFIKLNDLTRLDNKETTTETLTGKTSTNTDFSQTSNNTNEDKYKPFNSSNFQDVTSSPSSSSVASKGDEKSNYQNTNSSRTISKDYPFSDTLKNIEKYKELSLDDFYSIVAKDLDSFLVIPYYSY